MKIQRRPAAALPFAAGDLHPVIQRLYAARGVSHAAEIDYRLGNLVRPELLHGIADAALLLAVAVEQDRQILICGDFDADGATGTALAVRALRGFGARRVGFAVPNRFEFGYGLSQRLVESVLPQQPELIVTVDNGISSLAGVARARDAGIDVVVTDHHLPGAELPAASAIVNPNQPGDGFPSKALAGVGVMFYVMAAVRAELEKRGWFKGRRPPTLASLLDLVALGTVADLVPLDVNNRCLVAQGLARIRAGQCQPGIRALIDCAGLDQRRVGAADLGFALGPRLNAAGRLDDMALGIQCLLDDDPRSAATSAAQLDRLNLERRELQAKMQSDAGQHLAQLEATLGALSDAKAVALFDPGWHQGVVGLLAARVKEQLHRPTIVFAPAAAGSTELKGSARSISGFHIRDALADIAAAEPGLIDKFGGHAMAAGLSLPHDQLARFQQAWVSYVEQRLPPALLQQVIETDGELGNDEINLELADAVWAAGPWGQAFPEPVFEGRFELLDYRVVGQGHLKLRLATGRTETEAIAFNAKPEQLPRDNAPVRLLYQLQVNEFRGRRKVELRVRHILPEGDS